MNALTSLALAALAVGCGGESNATVRHRVTFLVFSDLAPVPGVVLANRGIVLSRTNADGAAQLTLTGTDGTVVPITVRCPAGTRAPAAPVDVTLRTMQLIDRTAAARGIVHRVNCPPEDRTIGVVVRTNGKAGLPVTWQGREIARTDAAGVASITFHVRPTQQIQLALATTEQTTLRPQNPARQFAAPDADEIFVWDQPFDEEAPRVRRRVRRTRRIGPVRIR